MVTGFHPGVGPVSGGSRLTVIGRHLDVGSHVTAVLTNGDNATVHCQLYGDRFHETVVCITGSIAKPTAMNHLIVSIDSARVDFAGRFDFVPDPVIESVTPFRTIIRYLITIYKHSHLISLAAVLSSFTPEVIRKLLEIVNLVFLQSYS